MKNSEAMMKSRKITILFIRASPPDTQTVDTDTELRNLKEAVSKARHGSLFNVEVVFAARVDDLLPALRQYEPHIVHFAGHGSNYGELYFNATNRRESHLLAAEVLDEIFGVYTSGIGQESSYRIHLAVLAGCYTEHAAKLLVQHVDCAIGFSGRIGDASLALVYTPGLYQALADGCSVQNAIESAIVSMKGSDDPNVAADAALALPPFVGSHIDPHSLILTDLHDASQDVTESHASYLQTFFKQRWATIKMGLFDPYNPELLDLLDLYTPLPVDLCIMVKLKDQRNEHDWWCERFGTSWDMTQQLESWDLPWLDRSRTQTVDELTSATEFRQSSWVDLKAGEKALLPLVNIALSWAESQELDARQKLKPIRWQADANHAALVQQRFVLVGEPGSGKSTFLRHLALVWAAELLRKKGETQASTGVVLGDMIGWVGPALTPVYMELRTIAETFPALPLLDRHPELPGLSHFEDCLRDQLLGLKSEEFYSELITRLKSGHAALLLDGLDEVSDADDYRRRLQVQSFVAAVKKAFSNAPIIVTARPYAYRPDNQRNPMHWELDGFGHTSLTLLDPERQALMVSRLFSHLPHGGAHHVNEFTAALADIPNDITGNPLLLTLLAAVSIRRSLDELHSLPKTRGELYRRALNLLLEGWVRTHHEKFSAAEALGLDEDDLRLVLQIVACQAHEKTTQPNQPVTIKRGDFYEAMDDIGKGEATKNLLMHLRRTAGMLLDLVEQTPGPVISDSPVTLRFLHLSFQEYLTACEMLNRPGTIRPHQLPVHQKRSFPTGLAQHIWKQPRLWANVLRLAVDELFHQSRWSDVWELLALCTRPYRQSGDAALGTLLALKVALDADLFQVLPERRNEVFYQELRAAAIKTLTDYQQFTPEQRDVAGRLLGSGPFPGHDTRNGVGIRRDKLPDIDWVRIAELDPRTGQSQWTYQDEQRSSENTFWISSHPVTVAQYQLFLDAPDGFNNSQWWTAFPKLSPPAARRRKSGRQNSEYWNHPCESVSWYDAMVFCYWLTDRIQIHIRDRSEGWDTLLPIELSRRRRWRITLPTEYQWEKTARGHDGRLTPWGDDFKEGYANVDETSHDYGSSFLQKASAVGMYPHSSPEDSPYGVADLCGNVSEWCFNEFKNPDSNRVPGDGMRALRGGSWKHSLSLANATSRSNLQFPYSRQHGGFRVALVGFARNV